MARSKGSANFSGSLEVLAGAPLDARLVVNTKADLTAATSYPYKYIGMIVSVKSEGRAYMLIDSDTTKDDSWKVVGGDTLDVTIYKPAGSIMFADRPTLSGDFLGNVYNIEDDFVTTADFIEGAGINHSAGTNIVIVDTGTTTPEYKWDVLSDSIDLSDYQKKNQYASMPTADADLVNEIYQYVGATNAYYTNGYFYKCVENPSAPGTYIWEDVDTQKVEGFVAQLDTMPTVTSTDNGTIVQYVGPTNNDYINGYFYIVIEDPDNSGSFIWHAKKTQQDNDTKIQVETFPPATAALENTIYQYVGESVQNYTNGYFYKCVEDTTTPGNYVWKAIKTQVGGSGSSTLSRTIVAAIGVGGIDAGDSFALGTSYDDMWDALLNPTLYPTFTAPSASLTYSVDTYYEVGSSISAKPATVNYNAGAITVNGTKQNNRGGAATGYTLTVAGSDSNNGDTTNTTGSFTAPALSRATKGTITITGKVAYGEGPQPKDSKGGDYNTPLAAGTVTASKTINFIQAFYYGASSSSSISALTGLSKSVTAKGTKTFNYTTSNQYQVFAYDSSYGNLTSILDPNSFETISGWNKTTVTIGGFSYNVYVTKSQTTDTNAKFTFKF